MHECARCNASDTCCNTPPTVKPTVSPQPSSILATKSWKLQHPSCLFVCCFVFCCFCGFWTVSLCAYGMHHIHFHSPSGTLRQPNVTLTGRAAGYRAVILATGLQGGRSGGRKRWIDEESVGWSGFSPLLSLSSVLAPGLRNQAYWSVKFLML